MKIASEENGDLWRDYGEMHPQKRLNPDLRVAGYSKRPMPGSAGCPALGHCRRGQTEEVPMEGCCLPPH